MLLIVFLIHRPIAMKRYFSGFPGTLALVFFGTGAIVITQEVDGAVPHAGITIPCP